MCNHYIFRLDTLRNLTYLCAVPFNNNDYGKRESKLLGDVLPRETKDFREFCADYGVNYDKFMNWQ